MADVNQTTSITTLTMTGLNNPIKSQRLSDCILKIRFNYRLSTWSLRFKDTNWLRVKEWEKIESINSNHKKVGVAISLSNKIDFKKKLLEINRDVM